MNRPFYPLSYSWSESLTYSQFERNFPFFVLRVWPGGVSLFGVILFGENFLCNTLFVTLLDFLDLLNFLEENLSTKFPDDAEKGHEYNDNFSPKLVWFVCNSMQTAPTLEKCSHKSKRVRHQCEHNRFLLRLFRECVKWGLGKKDWRQMTHTMIQSAPIKSAQFRIVRNRKQKIQIGQIQKSREKLQNDL